MTSPHCYSKSAKTYFLKLFSSPSSTLHSYQLHTHTHTPVSYTHLDVYKRQTYTCIHMRARQSKRNKITYFPGSLKNSWILQVYWCLKGMDEYYLIPLPFSEVCKFHFEIVYYACNSAIAHASLANNPLYYLRISPLVGTNTFEKK